MLRDRRRETSSTDPLRKDICATHAHIHRDSGTHAHRGISWQHLNYNPRAVSNYLQMHGQYVLGKITLTVQRQVPGVSNVHEYAQTTTK